MFTRAIVRQPAANFFEGLTTAGLGAPDYETALRQHETYCAALERCGLTLTRLEADREHPDSTFVEDAAVLLPGLADDRASAPVAILTRPGAASRRNEVTSMRRALESFFPGSAIRAIEPPGTLDGGDICEAADHFFIGISERTNETGANQLAEILDSLGYTTRLVDIRRDREVKSVPGADRGPRVGSPRGVVVATGSLLHLKSGLAYLGGNRLVVTKTRADREEFTGFQLLEVNHDEEYAANCVKVNDYVLVAAGYPVFQTMLEEMGYQTIPVEMSEFQKMDGGLSCLSLRF
jgi:dimethylargininase